MASENQAKPIKITSSKNQAKPIKITSSENQAKPIKIPTSPLPLSFYGKCVSCMFASSVVQHDPWSGDFFYYCDQCDLTFSTTSSSTTVVDKLLPWDKAYMDAL